MSCTLVLYRSPNAEEIDKEFESRNLKNLGDVSQGIIAKYVISRRMNN